MANIKDVALRANVSVTTVSHVVNGTRFVSEDARSRVEEAIRTLGYVPSAVARSLKHNTTQSFGVLVISVLEAGLAQIGASEPTKRIITGCVIIVAVVLDMYRERRNRKH